MPRGGDFGGGPTVRRIDLSDAAAEELRRRSQVTGTRYRKEEANQTASAILETLATGQAALLVVSSDVLAALPWLEQTRDMCFNEEAQRGIDQLIAALWTAKNRRVTS